MALPIDSTPEHAERASFLAESRSWLRPETAMRVLTRTRSRSMVHLLIHTCESRARRPRYGVMYGAVLGAGRGVSCAA